jgi:hypothetical protein
MDKTLSPIHPGEHDITATKSMTIAEILLVCWGESMPFVIGQWNIVDAVFQL